MSTKINGVNLIPRRRLLRLLIRTLLIHMFRIIDMQFYETESSCIGKKTIIDA